MFMPTSEVTADLDFEAQNVETRFPIKLDQLCFATAQKDIVKSISLSIGDVPCTSIIGHNGAGKSVLLRLMHGLLRPTSGTIEWGNGGLSVDSGKPHSWQAMVFQKPLLLNRSVSANLHFVLKRRGLRGAERRAAVDKYLALADLESAANRPAKVLSGGEAQRLAIVRALAMEPRLLFLDEPTASLDPSAKSSVERLLQNIMQRGVRMILVTQDIGQAGRLATDVVVMHQGRVVEHGPAEEVLNSPRSVEASSFLAHQI